MTFIELVMWESVRSAMKYPLDDNNDGYIYGINILSNEDYNDNEILDVMWFKTQEEREKTIANLGEVKILAEVDR